MKKVKSKSAKPVLDISKLPDKYFYDNQENLTDGKFVDDNSLFVYYLISRGIFSINPEFKRDSGTIFLYYQPFEWTSVDFISFLLSVSNKYNLTIKEINTYLGAVEDEYEISYEPKKYKGAYNWILELEKKEPNREEVILFNKLSSDNASVLDIERALIYAERLAPIYKGGETSELYLSKDIFRTTLEYSHFSFSLDSIKKSKIGEDVDSYIEIFMQEKLIRNNKSKRIGNASVVQSKNIFTFKKHSLLFREYLQKMYDNYGSIITVENIFEEEFPNGGYPEAEVVRNRYKNRNFFFIHILLAFQKQGFIKLLYIGSGWDFYEDTEQKYQAKIEILSAFFNNDLSKKLYFDPDKSILVIGKNEIKFRKFTEQYHTLRIVFENSEFLVICPFASKSAFQVIITPKKHQPYFERISENQKWQLAEAFKEALGRVYKGLKDPAYNFYLHTAPCDGTKNESYHWHWTILPKTSIWAGFEIGTRMEISTIEPEVAASHLRKQK